MVLFFLLAHSRQKDRHRRCVRGDIMTPRLLVPDNGRDLLYLYQLILEPEGYDVHVAASGFEQVTTIEHFQPDLLNLDHHLSRRRDDAEPLLRQLKAYPPTSALPVILCTADPYAISDQEDFLRALHVGVILKPFAIATLVQLVSQMLQKTATPTA
jgi:CheY-like chemotaxis protein